LYAFVRRSGHDAETSKDLTQGFFERFLEKDYLREVNPERGRFRSFLLASLKHFLANERDRRQTLRRGGHYRFVVLDENWIESCERQDAGAGLTPEALYELRWALAVLDSVRARLAADYSTAGKGQLFDALQVYLTGEPGHAPYAEVAARLDLSVDAVKKSVERLRRRYGELLREEIAQAVSHPREIEDEIQHLRRVLAG
jgi:RNA polymerase sigma-70 factor (ECF subfamily)